MRLNSNNFGDFLVQTPNSRSFAIGNAESSYYMVEKLYGNLKCYIAERWLSDDRCQNLRENARVRAEKRISLKPLIDELVRYKAKLNPLQNGLWEAASCKFNESLKGIDISFFEDKENIEIRKRR